MRLTHSTRPNPAAAHRSQCARILRHSHQPTIKTTAISNPTIASDHIANDGASAIERTFVLSDEIPILAVVEPIQRHPPFDGREACWASSTFKSSRFAQVTTIGSFSSPALMHALLLKARWTRATFPLTLIDSGRSRIRVALGSTFLVLGPRRRQLPAAELARSCCVDRHFICPTNRWISPKI